MAEQEPVPTLEELLVKLGNELGEDEEEIYEEPDTGIDPQEILRKESAALILSAIPGTDSFNIDVKIAPTATPKELDGFAQVLFYMTNNPKTLSLEIANIIKSAMEKGAITYENGLHVLRKWTDLHTKHSEVPVIRASEVLGITEDIKRKANGSR